MAAGGGAPVSTFASLRVRNYRLYFLGQGVSGAGTWMQNIAVGWLALQLTHSGVVLGVVTAARYAPLVLFGPWGGLIVDRTDTRRLLCVTQVVAGALSLALGVASATGRAGLAVLVVTVFGLGMVDVFDVPARQSIIGMLVDRQRLGNAVALNSITTNAARALGPAIGGAVIATLGVSPCFFVNAFSYGAVLASLLLMRISEILPARRETATKGAVRAGLRYVRHSPQLLGPLVMVAVTGTLTWEYPVSLPLLTTSTFHGTAAAYGVAMSLLGIGSVVGGFLAARRPARTTRSLAVAAVLWGATGLAIAVAPALVDVYVLMLFTGWGVITFNAAAKTLLQTESSAHMRGRVMALWFIAWQGSTVVGAPLVGAIGNTLGPRYAMALGGAAAVLVGAVYVGRPSTAVEPLGQVGLGVEPVDD